MNLKQKIKQKIQYNTTLLNNKTITFLNSNKRTDRDDLLRIQGKLNVLKELETGL